MVVVRNNFVQKLLTPCCPTSDPYQPPIPLFPFFIFFMYVPKRHSAFICMLFQKVLACASYMFGKTFSRCDVMPRNFPRKKHMFGSFWFSNPLLFATTSFHVSFLYYFVYQFFCCRIFTVHALALNVSYRVCWKFSSIRTLHFIHFSNLKQQSVSKPFELLRVC